MLREIVGKVDLGLGEMPVSDAACVGRQKNFYPQIILSMLEIHAQL